MSQQEPHSFRRPRADDRLMRDVVFGISGYPAVLVETGEEDSRVDPCHARKLAARLQAATSCGDEHPILVRIEARAGHGQGKPARRQAEEGADVLAFLRDQLGV